MLGSINQWMIAIACVSLVLGINRAESKAPNILIAIADDQSFPHASAYDQSVVDTPGFDRVARDGALFRNAFTPAPGCSPMRAAFLTGREIWQLREAGTHGSSFPADLPVFTNQLAAAGYHVGMTGKGWGPGKAIGWPHNPAGKNYSARESETPRGINDNDYAANFEDFLADRSPSQPFCFWFGCHEPHRVYDPGIGRRHGIEPAEVNVPAFLPDAAPIRSDIADYLYEIQWFDSHLMRMLGKLEQIGQLENTLVIVTSDNGMPFPRAKANLYEYGIHMPLAISWPARVRGGQQIDELVSLVDVTRTIFTAAGVDPQASDQMAGRCLIPLIAEDSETEYLPRDAVYSGRERHSSSRYRSLGYPSRCIRTQRHLFIRNFTPERWPAGAPRKYAKARFDANARLIEKQMGPEHAGYHDIDNGPTLRWMIEHRDDPQVAKLFNLAVGHRPAEELYDIAADPACLHNLASQDSAADIKRELAGRLENYLRHTGDLRVVDPVAAQVWETYRRFAGLRWFPKPAWAIEHPERVPSQPWLDERRPITE